MGPVEDWVEHGTCEPICVPTASNDRARRVDASMAAPARTEQAWAQVRLGCQHQHMTRHAKVNGRLQQTAPINGVVKLGEVPEDHPELVAFYAGQFTAQLSSQGGA
eukprot:3534025-Alexandrium_andersonii.AAC.1